MINQANLEAYDDNSKLKAYSDVDYSDLEKRFDFADFTEEEINSSRISNSKYFIEHFHGAKQSGWGIIVAGILTGIIFFCAGNGGIILFGFLAGVIAIFIGSAMISAANDTKPRISILRQLHFNAKNPQIQTFFAEHNELNLPYSASHFGTNGYHVKWWNSIVYDNGWLETSNYSYDTKSEYKDKKGKIHTTYTPHSLPYIVIRTPFNLPAVKFVHKGMFHNTNSPLERKLFPTKFSIKAGFDSKYNTFIRPGTEQEVLQIFTEDVLEKIYDLDLNAEIQVADNQVYFFLNRGFGYNLKSELPGKRFGWTDEIVVKLLKIHTEIIENIDFRYKLNREQQQEFAEISQQILNRK
ncbi:MAG: hypothetical protein LBT37_08495 [Lactobacillaceae bacterium]|jgi:hypothetical protein|nr:hypothetical protein [Lactobacillaceae bacterium]